MTMEPVQRPGEEGAEQVEAASLSQWQLIRRRFARHKLAVASSYVLVLLYVLAAFAEFFAPYPSLWKNLDYGYSPPQLVRVSFSEGLYVNALNRHVDPITYRKVYVEDEDTTYPLSFFVKGEPYKLWGLIPCERHFLGIDREAYADGEDIDAAGESAPAPVFYLLGADKYGRDICSRTIYGARVSLSVGVIAIAATFLLGIVVGVISGYVGGATDNFIQRSIEIINAFPKLPLWLALGAAVPPEWSPLRTYFAITLVLSLVGWTGLARVVRGKMLSLREEDYALAARLAGAGHGRIMFRHLLPGFTSHIIVSLTLTVPYMILGETALSFLGLGLRHPVVSWGVMLQDCMNMQVIGNYPWLLQPIGFFVLTILCFNFLGDGLRDAADPYAAR